MENKQEISVQTAPVVEGIPVGIAKVFYDSGIFKDIHSEAQALVKILAGREMGLSPIQSMQNIDIIKGNITYSSKIIAAMIKESNGKYDYKIKKSDDKECVIEFFRNNESQGLSTFGEKEAIKAGLISENDIKDNYRHYSELMYFYRALAHGVKKYLPDVLNGRGITEDFTILQPLLDDYNDRKKPFKVGVSIENNTVKLDKIQQRIK